jgi:hypothetical protein
MTHLRGRAICGSQERRGFVGRRRVVLGLTDANRLPVVLDGGCSKPAEVFDLPELLMGTAAQPGWAFEVQ